MLKWIWFNAYRPLPTALLSRGVGVLTRSRLIPRAIHRAAIRLFARAYGIDLTEAALPLEEFPSFGAFFTRHLKAGARPVAPDADGIVSPVDARVAMLGTLSGAPELEVKGRRYSLAALLGDAEAARRFQGGVQMTLYLSPRDYHRIHVPVDGEVVRMRYIPGRLFPVSPGAVRSLPNLFCVNERLITYLATKAGLVAVVKVGATCVGRIGVVYDPLISNTRSPAVDKRCAPPVSLAKGAELGRFEMGSTVVLLFEPGAVAVEPTLNTDDTVRVGQLVARIL